MKIAIKYLLNIIFNKMNNKKVKCLQGWIENKIKLKILNLFKFEIINRHF